MTSAPTRTGYAPVNGLHMYYEIHGEGEPLILLHGGFGLTAMFEPIMPLLAANRQVIAVDLQGHGRTADIDRPLSVEAMGDDIVALIRHLGFEQADVMGYSTGAAVALRAAIQQSQAVRRLVLVSIPFKRDGWYPEVRAGMDQVNAAVTALWRDSPIYQSYAAVAPEPDKFGQLADKMGEMVRREYDWEREVASLPMPVLLVYGDADSVPPLHAAAFFALLGGGTRDAGWDGAGMPRSRLAILPGTTHYTIFAQPALAAVVNPFLDTPVPAAA